MPNVFLFGPPGIGKSTIVRRLQAMGIPSFDFESIWSDQNKVHSVLDFVRSHPEDKSVVFGSAGLPPTSFVPGLKVLLYLDQKSYDLRRKERDIMHPEKESQAHHSIQSWFEATRWDRMIPANSRAIGLIVNTLEA